MRSLPEIKAANRLALETVAENLFAAARKSAFRVGAEHDTDLRDAVKLYEEFKDQAPVM